MSESNFEEKRQSKRIQKHFILKYYDVNNPNEKYSVSQLKNISEGGMCLITEKPFEPGTLLGVEIKSPFFASVTHMEGKVLGSHEKAKDIIYETRLEFQKLSGPAQEVVKKTIEFFDNKEN